MSSLTIDQLKRSLTEQGVALPPSGSKKADYVKLYEQYSTLNDNLADFSGSDDENPRSSSQSVTSSSSPSKLESLIKEVERLTDDELYTQLKELGASIGPVLKNTRKVYEKKLVKLLGGGDGQTNGVDTTGARKTNSTFRVEEFSDSEVDLPTIKSTYRRTEYRDSFNKGRKSSVTRDSPKPSLDDTVPEPELEKRFMSRSYADLDRKPLSTGNYSSELKSSKFSFIETIPKGSSHRYFEPSSEVDYPSNTFRSRFNTEKPSADQDDYYSGTWEPNIKKYLGAQQQSKILRKAPGGSTIYSKSSYKENIIGVLIVIAFILLILYVYFYQWAPADPYKEIEDDTEREIENLLSKSVD